MDILQAIARATLPLKRAIQLSIGRAIVSMVKDSGGLQTMQIELLADEVRSEVERFQNFGFTSWPEPGAEAIAVFVGGNREHGAIIAVDDRKKRLKLATAGEAAMYDAAGNFVWMKNGEIHIKHSGKVTVEAPHVDVKGGTVNVGLSGDEKTLLGESFQDHFNKHTHIGNMGAPTSPPQNPSLPIHLSQTVKVAK